MISQSLIALDIQQMRRKNCMTLYQPDTPVFYVLAIGCYFLPACIKNLA